MKTTVSAAIDKTTWGAGPWQNEPDHEEFRHAGFPCIIHRIESHGGWCGYVGVPPDHWAHGAHYDDVEVDVHGGLTYGEKCQGQICHESDNVFWLGFDCAHCGDLSPGIASRFPWPPNSHYRDIEYVRAETRRLAEQLVETR